MNFDYPKTNKLSNTSRVATNTTENPTTTSAKTLNIKKRSPSQSAVSSSSVNSLNDLRILIQSAKRTNQLKTQLSSNGVSTSSS